MPLFEKDLIGVVACGGRSTRMGKDKSLLVYHDKPQRYHLYDMLSELCSFACISCNRDQAAEIPEGYRYVVDHPDYKDAGPLTSTLSVFREFPGRDLLLIACDYPYMTADEISRFIDFIAGKDRPAAFYDIVNKVFVPVLGYYPAGTEAYMLKVKTEPGYSLKRLLVEIPSLKYVPSEPRVLLSAETPDDYTKMRESIP